MQKTAWIFLLLLLLASTSTAGPLGYDMNGDGIWDDVATYVDQIHPDQVSSPERMATLQMVKAFQAFVKDSYSPTQSRMNGEALKRSLECSFYCNRQKAKQIYEALKIVILSNPERRKRFLAAEQSLAGEYMVIDENPEQWRYSCDFAAPEQPFSKPLEQGGQDGR